MNKFQSLIANNGSEVLQRRASNVATTAEIAQQTLINSLKVQKAELENRIMNLTDLAPDTSDSLKPGTTNWDPTEWAKSLQDAKEQLYNTNIRLQIAQSTYNEYFVDESENLV
jgi:hypothetical protein